MSSFRYIILTSVPSAKKCVRHRDAGPARHDGGLPPDSETAGRRGHRLQRKALVRSAGLRHGLRRWPPDLHLQKRLHLRGLSRVNTTLPIIGFTPVTGSCLLLYQVKDDACITLKTNRLLLYLLWTEGFIVIETGIDCLRVIIRHPRKDT